MKFDFNNIDPVSGMPKIKKRPEDDIHTMNIMPSRTGWIRMLQNRINLRSTGNIYQSKVVWYDRRNNTVCSDKNNPEETTVYFRLYRLPSGQIPQGWIYENN